MSKEGRKGACFERDVADYLAAVLGADIDRRVKHGVKDRGDIAGLFFRGLRVVAECKNRKRMELAGWLDEAEEERGNDDAAFGVVVHKRRGFGRRNVGGSYVTMTLETFSAMVAGSPDLLGRWDG